MILSCGPGTHVEADLCVPDSTLLGCGPGTRVDGTTCVPDGAYYDVRAIASALPADGRTKIQVLAIGRRADGAPATDEVLVVPDRSSAGAFPGAFALDPMGSVTYFTPCAAAAPDCLGPTTFRLVRASDPSIVLATTGPLELVAPTGVGSPAACLVGGNFLFVDANSLWVWEGIVDIRVAHWELRWPSYDATGAPTWLSFEIYPFDVSQAESWSLDFGQPSDGVGLHTGVYEDATTFGLRIAADAYSCGENKGRFEVQELERCAPPLDSDVPDPMRPPHGADGRLPPLGGAVIRSCRIRSRGLPVRSEFREPSTLALARRGATFARSQNTSSRQRRTGHPWADAEAASLDQTGLAGGPVDRLLNSRGMWLALGRAILPPVHVHVSQRERDQRSVAHSTFRIEGRGVTRRQGAEKARSNRTRMNRDSSLATHRKWIYKGCTKLVQTKSS